MLKNQKGFTLIELIIVMAIIGILAVVALLAITGKSVDARDARRLADANNLHLAFSLHAVNHGSDYLLGASPGVLLHNLANKNEIAYLINLDNVKDPVANRNSQICYDNIGSIIQCNQVGGYTIFDIYDDLADEYLGTFDNYAIGMKLEQNQIAYLDEFDWRELVGIKTVYATEGSSGEPYCGDGHCDNDPMLKTPETIENCPQDCGDIVGPGPDLSNPANKDWLYIGPKGIMRSSINRIDLTNVSF